MSGGVRLLDSNRCLLQKNMQKKHLSVHVGTLLYVRRCKYGVCVLFVIVCICVFECLCLCVWASITFYGQRQVLQTAVRWQQMVMMKNANNGKKRGMDSGYILYM